VTTIPIEQINDAHKLTADGELDLFVLTPTGSGATLHFKGDNDVTWQGNAYTGLPMTFTGEIRSVQGGARQPRLIIGQENVNLSIFKGLVFDGTLDGASIIRYHILLTDLLANNNIKTTHYYRVKRIESYSRSSINLQLAMLSDSLNFTMPFRTYTPPAFPAVSV
jgi:phage-related protein